MTAALLTTAVPLLASLLVGLQQSEAWPHRFGVDPFSPLGAWHSRSPPCRLPSFVEDLPTSQAERVRAIWATYKEGDECEQQHQQTREIVDELTEEQREKLFSGRCGPSFLRNVSITIRKEFRAVWTDHRLSLELKELALKKLAYSLLTGEALARFVKWEEELLVRKNEFNRKLAALSQPAREAFDNWKAIRLQERAFLASLPKSIRDELKSLCRPFGRALKEITIVASSSTTAATTTTTTMSTTGAPSTTTVEEQTEESSEATTTTAAAATTTAVEEASTTGSPSSESGSTTEATQIENDMFLMMDVQLPMDLDADSDCDALF